MPDAVVRHSPGTSLHSGTNLALEIVKYEDVLHFASKWLTGDVYRQLSLDGAQMTPAAVEREVA